MMSKKIQDYFGHDEIREIVKNSILARELEPQQNEHYRELTYSRYLLSYRAEDVAEVYVYFDYDRDNIVEYYFEEGALLEYNSWDRDLLLISFFGVDER